MPEGHEVLDSLERGCMVVDPDPVDADARLPIQGHDGSAVLDHAPEGLARLPGWGEDDARESLGRHLLEQCSLALRILVRARHDQRIARPTEDILTAARHRG